MISCIVASGTPARSATCMASAAAAMCTPHSNWLIILAVEPRPASVPTWKMRLATASKAGRAAASAASGPRHMMVSAARGRRPHRPRPARRASPGPPRPRCAARAPAPAPAPACTRPRRSRPSATRRRAAPSPNSTLSACSPETDHQPQQFGIRRRLGRAGGGVAAGADQRRWRSARRSKPLHLVPGGDQLGRHRHAHRAQADESDAHRRPIP